MYNMENLLSNININCLMGLGSIILPRGALIKQLLASMLLACRKVTYTMVTINLWQFLKANCNPSSLPTQLYQKGGAGM